MPKSLERILGLLACPECRGGLCNGPEIDSLVCTRCGRKFPVVNNVVSLVQDDLVHFSEVKAASRLQFLEAKKMAYFNGSLVSHLYGSYHRYAAGRRRKLPADSLIVDVGFGVGEHYRFITSREKTESRFIGVDLDRFKLEYFTDLHPDVPVVQASAFSLPFAANSVDILQALATLEHFEREDMGRVLDECLRVLKPGGVLIACYPAEGSMLLRLCQLGMHSLIRFRTGYDLEREDIHHHLLTATEIQGILRKRPDLKNVESMYFPLHLSCISLSLFLNETYIKL